MERLLLPGLASSLKSCRRSDGAGLFNLLRGSPGKRDFCHLRNYQEHPVRITTYVALRIAAARPVVNVCGSWRIFRPVVVSRKLQKPRASCSNLLHRLRYSAGASERYRCHYRAHDVNYIVISHHRQRSGNKICHALYVSAILGED